MPISYPQKTDDAVYDFVRAVYPKLVKKDFSLLCQTYTDYIVAGWFAAGRDKQKTGSRCTWSVVYKKGTSAKHMRLGEPDSVSIQQVSRRAHAQWCHFGFNYSWLRQEVLMVQNDPDALIDLMGSRRASEQIGALDELEEKAWSAPVDETDAEENPMGIPFWVQKDSGSTGGFTGGNPSGFSNGAGNLDSNTYTNWKNYTDTYSQFTDNDVVKKLRKAIWKMRYRRPAMIGKDIKAENYGGTKIYLNLETKLSLVDIAKGNNDSMGWDLGVGDSEVRFYRHTLDYVPYLDNDSDNPIYLIDLNTLYPIVLKGDRFHESEVRNSEQHDYFTVFVDLTYQYVCDNRRHNGVLIQV